MPILLARINTKRQVLNGECSYTSEHRSMREANEALENEGFLQEINGMTTNQAEKKILLAFIGINGKLWEEAPGPYISPCPTIEKTDVELRKAGFTSTLQFPISAKDQPIYYASD